MRVITYLQQKPMVGAASGIGAGIIPRLFYLLTDDWILKVVSGLATWAGCMVVLLTLIIKFVSIYQKLKIKRS